MAVSGLRRAMLAFGLAVLAGCGETYQTSYSDPVSASVTRGWRIVDVRVDVPESVTVSEAHSFLPQADIVWREDPPGDRKVQVAKIVADAARAASGPLRGARPVVLSLTLTRFHALTFEAETRLSGVGVHNISFVLSARDARTGELLAGPDSVDADLPAYSGTQMTELRVRGQTQRSQISAHLRAVFAGWLGIGPDVRGSFSRAGD
ncbi:MAG: DUF6778 family protein [Paracoccaceae bacterium]